MKSIMEKYEIIKLKNDGWSSRRISKTFGISRNTIKKYWGEYQDNLNLLISADASEIDKRKVTEEIIEKTKYDSSNRHARKYSFEMDQALRKILDDEDKKTQLLGKHHKQALTKTQIHSLLVAQGFDISLVTISNKINEIRNDKKEVFIKQDYEYGDRFEYDFGEVDLIIDGKKTKGFLAVLTSPASGFRWAYLYRNTKMAVFLDSHAQFFEMIGGTFKEGVYDNMRNVVTKFIGRSEKQLNTEIIQLSLYYGFSINVTNCFSGNEKGTVESAVRWIRKKVFAVNYQFNSFDEASEYLQNELVKINRNSKIEEEKNHLLPYRPKYETAVITLNQVDKYAFIHVDGNCYSVPEDLCEKKVTVKSYPNDIYVLYGNETVAHHIRHAGKGKTYVDIYHYLHTFMKKPGALNNSLALKSQPKLKEIFDLYYKEKPKLFIELLRENSGKEINELTAALMPVKSDTKIETVSEIEEKTDNQISILMELFIGGKDYVN